ncbi:MAG: hypothetical protein IH600_05690 [Bacteroidetes bacterium]|nr:hypothetical protein [Bacteroidota bacterium]
MLQKFFIIAGLMLTLSPIVSSQIRTGACKMNFWGNSNISFVHANRISDLGFDAGEFTSHTENDPARIIGNAGYFTFMGSLPAGFELYIEAINEIVLVGSPCENMNSWALRALGQTPVFKLQAEFSSHYPNLDKDNNSVKGVAEYNGDANGDPSYVELGITNNVWQLDQGETIEPGTALACPIRISSVGDPFNDYITDPPDNTQIMNICEIRLRGEMTGVNSSDTILIYHQWEAGPSGWIDRATTASDDRVIVANQFGTGDWFTVKITGINLTQILECEFEWSGKGDVQIDEVTYYTACTDALLAGDLDDEIDDIIESAQIAQYGDGEIVGFVMHDEPWADQILPTEYASEYIRNKPEGYRTRYWVNPWRLYSPVTEHLNHLAAHQILSQTTSLDLDIYPFYKDVADTINSVAFQADIQRHVVSLLQELQDINISYYNKELHCTVQSFALNDIYKMPSPEELNLEVNLCLGYGAKSIWYFVTTGGVTGSDTYTGLIADDGSIVSPDMYNAVKNINERLAGDWGFI